MCKEAQQKTRNHAPATSPAIPAIDVTLAVTWLNPDSPTGRHNSSLGRRCQLTAHRASNTRRCTHQAMQFKKRRLITQVKMSHFDFVTSAGQTEASSPSMALQAPNQYQAHVVTRQSSENSDLVNQTFGLVPLYCSRHLTVLRKQLRPSI
jgi:hypothetical protein